MECIVISILAVVLVYCQNHETSGNILVPLLEQEWLFKWQNIAFFRAYLDTILKALAAPLTKMHASFIYKLLMLQIF